VKRLGVALALTLGVAASGYLLLLGVGSLAGAWPREVLGQQARALLLHFTLIGARGIVPGILLTAAGARALRAWPGLRERGATWGAALASAALITPTVLESGVGLLPRLAIDGPVNVAASVSLLAAASAAGWLTAGRIVRAAPVDE
jgi:hypothetical protein